MTQLNALGTSSILTHSTQIADAGSAAADLAIVNRIESEVRAYCREFPVVFKQARGAEMFDVSGQRYIDFLSAAGSLNYGHNNLKIKRAVLAYLMRDGVIQGLDMATDAKLKFMQRFTEDILSPRGLSYKMQFTGPTGANAVEAAIKLARKVTGRRPIACFTNAFHGVSLGALALTGSRFKRQAANVSLDDAIRLPYDSYVGDGFDTMAFARQLFEDPSSGFDAPAAFIVETVQGEGGLHMASAAWLQKLSHLARDLGALLIVDDIQAGCGRAGTFFSFEGMEIEPDVICLSKSIGGIGLPMSLVLIKPERDLWAPAEHNGTFRGNNLAFVAAEAAIDYWHDEEFTRGIEIRSAMVTEALLEVMKSNTAHKAEMRGRGMFQGVAFDDPVRAIYIKQQLFKRHVIAETCGPKGEVLKLMPPLNIPLAVLGEGLQALIEVAAQDTDMTAVGGRLEN